MEVMKRNFDATVNVRRCLVLKTIPEELTRSTPVGWRLRLEVCKEKLKQIADGGSIKTGRRLRAGINLPSMLVGHFLFH